MFKYCFYNEKKIIYDENIIKSIFYYIDKIIKKKQNGILNIVFCNDKYIKKLNNSYRSINKTTDVLSFHYYLKFLKNKQNIIVGELFFCIQKIKKQGLIYGLGEEREFYKLLIHSVLHILGYNHESDEDYKNMSKIEKKIWDKIFI